MLVEFALLASCLWQSGTFITQVLRFALVERKTKHKNEEYLAAAGES
jgi:hypothetical protein